MAGLATASNSSLGTQNALLNIAATCSATRSLGPGLRAVVWVQGCPFRCRGCIVPEWLPNTPARLIDADTLAGELLTDERVDGLTFSGGEPMLQADALARVVRTVRRSRDVSLICFTGYRLERLQTRPPADGVGLLLGEVDVLIDGPYAASRNDGQGMRGSDNQRIHHLTDRLLAARDELESAPRRVEVHVDGTGALLVGVPGPGVLEAFDAAMDRVASIGSAGGMR
jgi:anaerobic ribonucleoside-triphosphate reductase activating protein